MNCPNCNEKMEREDTKGIDKQATDKLQRPVERGTSSWYYCEECGFEAVWCSGGDHRWEVIHDPRDRAPIYNGQYGFEAKGLTADEELVK